MDTSMDIPNRFEVMQNSLGDNGNSGQEMFYMDKQNQFGSSNDNEDLFLSLKCHIDSQQRLIQLYRTRIRSFEMFRKYCQRLAHFDGGGETIEFNLKQFQNEYNKFDLNYRYFRKRIQNLRKQPKPTLSIQNQNVYDILYDLAAKLENNDNNRYLSGDQIYPEVSINVIELAESANNSTVNSGNIQDKNILDIQINPEISLDNVEEQQPELTTNDSIDPNDPVNNSDENTLDNSDDDVMQLNRHKKRRHSDARPFNCDKCELTFKTKSELKLHQNIHKGQRFGCTFEGCTANYAFRKDLIKHIKIFHTKETPLLHCNWEGCDYTTRRSQYFKIHQKVHTGERPFKCPDCEMAFKTQATLCRHKLAHQTERRFKCDFEGCDYASYSKKLFQSHQFVHNVDRPFNCDLPGCGKSFKSPYGIWKHKAMHGNESRYRCKWEGCEFAAYFPYYLRLHVQTVHEKKKIPRNRKNVPFKHNPKPATSINEVIESTELANDPTVKSRSTQGQSIQCDFNTSASFSQSQNCNLDNIQINPEISLDNVEVQQPELTTNDSIDPNDSVNNSESHESPNDSTISERGSTQGNSIQCDFNDFSSVCTSARFTHSQYSNSGTIQIYPQISLNNVEQQQPELTTNDSIDPNDSVNNSDENTLDNSDDYDNEDYFFVESHKQTAKVENKKLSKSTKTVAAAEKIPRTKQEISTDSDSAISVKAKRRPTNRDTRKVFVCEVEGCEYSTIYSWHLKLHKRRKHSDVRPFNCGKCDAAFKTKGELKLHQNIHEGQRFSCTFEGCTVNYSSRQQLNKHIKIFHTKEAPLLHCNWDGCDYSNYIVSNLRIHQKGHTGERPFKCPDCEMAFKAPSHLRGHKLIHQTERRYKCDFEGCDYASYSKKLFQNHQFVHTDECPFNCDLPGCGKSFKSPYGLKYHKTMHRNKGRYQCKWEGCEYAANFSCSLRLHVQIVHEKKKIPRNRKKAPLKHNPKPATSINEVIESAELTNDSTVKSRSTQGQSIQCDFNTSASFSQSQNCNSGTIQSNPEISLNNVEDQQPELTTNDSIDPNDPVNNSDENTLDNSDDYDEDYFVEYYKQTAKVKSKKLSESTKTVAAAEKIPRTERTKVKQEISTDSDLVTLVKKKRGKSPNPDIPKVFRCDVDGCQYSITNLGQLNQHKKRRHSDARPFNCDKCELTFKTKRELKLHQNIHEGQRFECTFKGCTANYAFRKDLIKHIKIFHTKEAPLLHCNLDGCDFSTYFGSNLRIHQKVHTGERPFKCPDCEMAYKTQATLSSHKRTHQS